MRSTSGAHFVALDHVRALAALLVVAWHFTHGKTAWPVPYEYVPSLFPFGLVDEGHTGVALFMTLSGYLFAKLLDGRAIDYGAFLWNRALRLLPLLVLVVVIAGVWAVAVGVSLASYAWMVVQGVLMPTLPNGGWSITVEFHFYLVLPLFLWMLRRSKLLPLSIVAAAVVLRIVLYQWRNGEIQSLAYFTLVGRIDQFALGMLAYHFRHLFTGRHLLAGCVITGFLAMYWQFDRWGGASAGAPWTPLSAFWVVLPTIEGMVYGLCIAWYDNSFVHSDSWLSRAIGKMGELSYSIYLLHFFFVFRAARFVHEHIMDISNFYVACAWTLVFFGVMMMPAWLSYRFVESPFLKLRKRYVLPAPVQATPRA